MGNKDSKNLDIDQFLRATGGVSLDGAHSNTNRSSNEALADCLASLSDMAHTGIDTSLSQLDIPGKGKLVDKSLTPGTVRRMSTKLKQKLQAQASSVSREIPPSNIDDLDGMLQNLSIQDGNDDNAEWASMRSWLVWCMHNNLREPDDDTEGLPVVSHTRGRRLSRQSAVSSDHGTRDGHRKLSYQTAFDVDREGKMSAQSSLESNAET